MPTEKADILPSLVVLLTSVNCECSVMVSMSGRQPEGEGSTPSTRTYDLSKAWIQGIGREQAKEFIVRYEWLRSIPTIPIKFYGLFFSYRLGGVVCFAMPPTPDATKVCGDKYSNLVCLLARGASADWAPKNTSSKLIGIALRLLRRDTRYRIIVAYADMRAGEIGTVYQATNWLYTGITSGDIVHLVEGKWHTGRGTRIMSKLRGVDYKEFPSKRAPGKHRYIKFLGSKGEQERYRRALKFPTMSYPKREHYPEYFSGEKPTFVQLPGEDRKSKPLWEIFG